MLNDKVIVVTGGCGLLGQVFIEGIVNHGGTAVIADIDISNAEKVKEKLGETYTPARIECVELNINSGDSIDDLIKKVSAQFGRIDGWVNSAYPKNKNYGRSFFDVAYSDFCENVNLNLGGYFLCCQRIGLFFKKQGHGNIVNISSIYGVIAPRFEVYKGTEMTMPVEYAVIKSALLHLTRYMARYFKGMNIRVNAVSPGGIFDHQPQQFLEQYKDFCLNKGMLDKTDLQGTVIFLLSDMSAYINGQNIIVDDGFTL